MVQTVTAPIIPPTLAIMPRAARASVALQATPPALPMPLTRAIDAAVAAYVPASIAADQPADMREDNRAWLAGTPQPAIVSRSGAGGKQAGVDYGAPPAGLGAVECVLWQELGIISARATLWLARFMATRRYMQACADSGLESHQVTACKIASPRFTTIFELVTTAVRAGTVAQVEDSLSNLATGAISRIKRERDGEGNVTKEVDEGPIYDTKAASLLLPALDPARYRQQAAAAVGASIAINIQYSGVGWGGRPVEVDVSGPAYDADTVPAEVSDTEEELG